MIAGLAALLLLFLLVLWQVQVGGPLVTFDGVVNAALISLRARPTLAAAAWISQVGTGAAGAVICLISSALVWSDGRTRLVLPIWLAFAGAQATTWPLKFVTARARPAFLDGITAASPSFPSAHATVSMAVYTIVALAVAEGVPWARAPVFAVAGLLIVLICFSRMLLSLHYFSDVLAGAAIGLFWALLAWRLGAQ